MGIKSLNGNTALLVNPWGTEPVQVRRAQDNTIITSSSDGEVQFDTESNVVYVVERTAKPLGDYAYAHITGSENQDAKYLSDDCRLGISAKAPPDTGKYEAEHGTLVSCSVSTDLGASNLAEVTNMSSGSSVSFPSVIAGDTIDVRYCTFNNPGKLGLYIDGVHDQDITFPSTQSWEGTYATQTVTAKVPQGATIKLQYDNGGSGANLDYIQVR